MLVRVPRAAVARLCQDGHVAFNMVSGGDYAEAEWTPALELKYQQLNPEVVTWLRLNRYIPRLSAPGLDLRGWRLPKADFRHANLEGAIFDEALLVDATFRGASLLGASFCKADLTRVEFDRASIHGANFDGALLTDASFDRVQR